VARRQAHDNHAQMHREFRWHVPQRFNIAEVCSARWARGADAARHIAIHADGPGQPARSYSYRELQEAANRLSGLLRQLGVRRGDRVAMVMPQRFETAVAYIAVFQLGAVAMPLSMLFGPEALEYRLQDSEAVAAVCDESSVANLLAVRAQCPALRHLIGVGAAAAKCDVDYAAALAGQPAGFECVDTGADEGALLIYTSGTTGPPKGALVPHRALIGNLTGFVCSQNWFGFPTRVQAPASLSTRARRTATATLAHIPMRGRGGRQQGEAQSAGDQYVFWSPADWAWTGGLMDALLPTLYFGRPIVAWNGRFSAETAFALLQKYGVTHTFLFPTALKAMMKAYPQPKKQFALRLQAIMSGGEAVGDAVFGWCERELGITVNEIFGQTEVNYIVGNCSMNGNTAQGVGWPARPGSMGRPYPGHRVAVIDEAGHECPVGVVGDVAVHRLDVHGDPDPVFFLGYWRREEATRAKYTGDWCRTGDLATRDADGYLWYQGRADDVFKAAGYRIGPSEIENCLVKHAAVANAAVVPKPDRERGAVVKAYVVLSAGYSAQRPAGDASAFDAALVAELQAHVRGKLAPYEYPKEIEFIDALPMTTTGKVQRRVLRLREEERARTLAA
jgi:acetyl-CoA synthetase